MKVLTLSFGERWLEPRRLQDIEKKWNISRDTNLVRQAQHLEHCGDTLYLIFCDRICAVMEDIEMFCTLSAYPILYAHVLTKLASAAWRSTFQSHIISTDPPASPIKLTGFMSFSADNGHSWPL